MAVAVAMRMSAAPKMQVGVGVPGQLPENIKESDGDERPAGDPGEEGPDPRAQRDPEPGDDETEHGGKRRVTGGGEGGDEQRF